MLETATGAPVQSSGSGKGSPASDKIEGMSLRDLKGLDVQRLNAEQRKALDRALKRHGF